MANKSVSNYDNADDSLSRTASAVVREIRLRDQQFDDIDAFNGPSECDAVVGRAFESRIRGQFHGCREEAERFIDECTARTTPRFVFEAGLLEAVDAFECRLPARR